MLLLPRERASRGTPEVQTSVVHARHWPRYTAVQQREARAAQGTAAAENALCEGFAQLLNQRHSDGIERGVRPIVEGAFVHLWCLTPLAPNDRAIDEENEASPIAAVSHEA